MDLPKNDQLLNVQDELRRLHEENAHLKALLAQHGIPWEGPSTSDLPGHKIAARFTGMLRKDQKVAVRVMLQYEIGVL